MSGGVRPATAADAPALASVAAVTFPLACPPHTTEAAIATFIAENLTEARFDAYLTDPTRTVLIAETDGEASGYVMLVNAEPSDADVAALITTRPTVELSKFYVLPRHHGAGVAADLMSAALVAAEDRGGTSVWLGVNEQNERANRFYEKQGFQIVGRRRFLVGDRWEHDFVRELLLRVP
jgi:ribosomal protein S18 acetylase RimI-like enzyme